MRIDPDDFRVRPGDAVHLDPWPTRVQAACRSKKQYRAARDAQVAELSALQRLLYASDRHAIWAERFQSIIDHERHLHRNGTRIIKFFLHLSREEQLERFLDRIDEPDKNWKFRLADLEERGFWPQYMRACEACLGATSTVDSPWYVVPADSKKHARLIIATIVLDASRALDMQYPGTDDRRRGELADFRRRLEDEVAGTGRVDPAAPGPAQ